MHTFTDHLAERIRRNGPIPVAAYMNMVAKEYYSRGRVFGHEGDFITAPEINQTFGELIGLWCAVTWENMGKPSQCYLVECGPGRGTLMADALRAAGLVPGFMDAIDVHLIEQSESLKTIQRETLKGYKITWHETFDTCPDGSLIVIGNEFLDALPIQQFEKTDAGWMERCVDIDDANQFQFTLRELSDADLNIPAGADVGAIYETSPDIKKFITNLTARIVNYGGAALFIDYGHKNSALGETLQAVKRHQPYPVLKSPGTADITAHVDFEVVAQAAQSAGAHIFGPIEQGIWLKRLGIGVRAAQLAQNKAQDVARNIEAGIRRLTEPDAMGALFKVIAIAHPNLPPPEGFS